MFWHDATNYFLPSWGKPPFAYTNRSVRKREKRRLRVSSRPAFKIPSSQRKLSLLLDAFSALPRFVRRTRNGEITSGKFLQLKDYPLPHRRLDMVRLDVCRCRTRKRGGCARCVWSALQSDTDCAGVCMYVRACARVYMDRLKHELHHSLEVKPNWIGLYISKGTSRSTSVRSLSVSLSQEFSGPAQVYKSQL